MIEQKSLYVTDYGDKVLLGVRGVIMVLLFFWTVVLVYALVSDSVYKQVIRRRSALSWPRRDSVAGRTLQVCVQCTGGI
jgi:hypothetical protein